MSEWTLGGLPVLEATLTLPSVGCWTARVHTDSAEVLAADVVLAHDGGLEWRGSVVRGRVAQGGGDWLVVGGTGGFRTPLDAKPYVDATLDDVLRDVLAEVAEVLSPESTALYGFALPRWFRMPGLAHHTVAEVARLAGLAWRVRADGALWLGADVFEPVTPPDDFDVIGEAPAHGRLVIAGDVLGIVPGVYLPLPDGDGVRVDVVEHRIRAVGSHSLVWRSDQ